MITRRSNHHHPLRGSGLKIIGLLALGILLRFHAAVAATGNTNAPARFAPNPNDGRIAYVAARLLETYHYSQHPLDAEISQKFFDGYLDTLDPQHLYFLKSDITEFAPFRTNLDTLTINNRGTADLTPALQIFQRFLERLKQRTAYEDKLLKRGEFPWMARAYSPGPAQSPVSEKSGRGAAPLAATADLRLPAGNTQPRNFADQQRGGSAVAQIRPAEITAKLTRHYHWILRVFTNWDSSDILQTYLNALAHAYDPHSDYLNSVMPRIFPSI